MNMHNISLTITCFSIDSIGDLNRSYHSINSVPSTASTPRGTPRGTPKLYGSMYNAAGSYTGRLGGQGASPAT